MREVDIKLKEVLVKSIMPTRGFVELSTVISVRNTNKTVDVPLGLGLPQDMAHAFFKKLRESQQEPAKVPYSVPLDFIEVIRFQDYENIEKKMLMFFRTMWHEVHHMKNHKSLTPRADKIEEIRSMRLRL